jgi:uncharacterized circularly permuted ATP-grasp superfamily protein
MLIDLQKYPLGNGFDELIDSDHQPRPAARALFDHIAKLDERELRMRRAALDATIATMGITFTIYSDGANIDRAWPFDIVPRIMAAAEWQRIEAGLRQRLTALNLFIDDLYNAQRIVRDGVFPAELLATSKNFRRTCVGQTPCFGAWAHVCGTDLVRDADGTVYVLEDNLRVPSGVSYMLENRTLMKRMFPELFELCDILPVDDYTTQLYAMLAELSPRKGDRPTIVVLTPGIYNSAYFEHSYLAQRMGIELVEGRDLVIDQNRVLMRTTRGLRRVDVIYRRIDDDFLDPLTFRPDSQLGVAGLVNAYRAGNVALANSIGTGIADDKGVYPFVPDMIRYYLKQDPVLPNVETFRPLVPAHQSHILANLDKLVVKAVNESGGYGMLIGPAASQKQRDEFRDLVRARPRDYIAQPTIQLSTHPTFVEGRLEGRHVDLRPFVLCGEKVTVVPGGLTRVALPRGSLVVNSSQGGGSKDTWVLAE